MELVCNLNVELDSRYLDFSPKLPEVNLNVKIVGTSGEYLFFIRGIFMNKFNELFYSTVLIVTDYPLGYHHFGTGFLLNITTDRYNFKGVVTNKHVVSKNIHTRFLFHCFDEDNNIMKDFACFELSENACYYIPHPNEDLCVVPVGGFINWYNVAYQKIIKGQFVYMQDIIDIDKMDFDFSQNIFIPGYPHGRYDESNNLPLMTIGHFASLPTFDFNGRKMFSVNANVFPGSSGAPVYINLSNSYYLIGVLTEGFKQVYDNLEGIKKDETMIDGYGKALKASLIYDLIPLIEEYVDEGPIDPSHRP